jgi:CO/xanthine dehydrogenase FAD-binding subunit
VRASATLGGNLVNASPVADMAVILLALGAELTLAGPQGERRLPLADFYLGFHRTGLHKHELVTAIHLPTVITAPGACMRRRWRGASMTISPASIPPCCSGRAKPGILVPCG